MDAVQYLAQDLWYAYFSASPLGQRLMGCDTGDLFYINAAGQPIVVVNKSSIAIDLLDRRATKYIDRPANIVGWEITTGGLFYAFGRFDDVFVIFVYIPNCNTYILQLPSHAQGLPRGHQQAGDPWP